MTISKNVRRWSWAVLVAWGFCCAFNLVCYFYCLQDILRFRHGEEQPTLSDPEYSALLQRAGGAFHARDSVNLTIKGPREKLFRELGVVVSFDPPNKPTFCVIKWYPESARSKLNNNTAPTEFSQNGSDPRAFSLVLDIASDDTLQYRYTFGNVESETRTLFAWGNNLPLRLPFELEMGAPIQPVSVGRDFDELVAEYPAMLRSLIATQRWRDKTLGEKHQFDDDVRVPDDEGMQKLSRVLEGVISQVFSPAGNVENSRPDRAIPSLKKATLAIRLLCGSNIFGWIQFIIVIVIVRGVVGALTSRRESNEEFVAHEIKDTLPAIGFLGTLLGMTLAFSGGLQDRNNLTQSLTLAISTSAIALVGALLVMSLAAPKASKHTCRD